MNLSALLAASTLALAVSPCAAQVTTSQYNNSRSAATLHENILTPQNVNAQHFGKLGTFKVDGAVYAQPLYVPAVPIPGKGSHDVLYALYTRNRRDPQITEARFPVVSVAKVRNGLQPKWNRSWLLRRPNRLASEGDGRPKKSKEIVLEWDSHEMR